MESKRVFFVAHIVCWSDGILIRDDLGFLMIQSVIGIVCTVA